MLLWNLLSLGPTLRAFTPLFVIAMSQCTLYAQSRTLYSRRSRIFPRRGPAFVWSAMSTRFSGGGGGSSRIFPWSPKAYAIQWGGGGVVAEIFRDLKKPIRFSGGGGVVAENFRGLQKSTRFGGGGGGSSAQFFFSVTSKRHFPLMGPFYIFLLSRRGARAPPESATAVSIKLRRSRDGMRLFGWVFVMVFGFLVLGNYTQNSPLVWGWHRSLLSCACFGCRTWLTITLLNKVLL